MALLLVGVLVSLARGAAVEDELFGLLVVFLGLCLGTGLMGGVRWSGLGSRMAGGRRCVVGVCGSVFGG